MRVLARRIAAASFVALAAGLLILAPEPASAQFGTFDNVPNGGFCARYASGAVQAAKTNGQDNCGFQGPRYGSDWQGHWDWCMNNTVGDVDEEAGKRTRQIKSCSTCRAHAREAVQQVGEFKALACKNTTGNASAFARSEQGHFQRCYAVVFPSEGGADDAGAQATIKHAFDQREQNLRSCRLDVVAENQNNTNPDIIAAIVRSCQAYADGAMAKVNDVCGRQFTPPSDGGRWNRDRRAHLDWCLLGASGRFNKSDTNFNLGSAMQAENQGREQQINACHGGAAFCGGFAKRMSMLTELAEKECPAAIGQNFSRSVADQLSEGSAKPGTGKTQRVVETHDVTTIFKGCMVNRTQRDDAGFKSFVDDNIRKVRQKLEGCGVTLDDSKFQVTEDPSVWKEFQGGGGGIGTAGQPLTYGGTDGSIDSSEGPSLTRPRVPGVPSGEGLSLRGKPAAKPPVATGGRDGSGDPVKPIPPQRGGPTLATPSPKNTPKPTGGSDGCGSAMDRLSGCIPAGAGGGSTLNTNRDPNRPPLAGGGGGRSAPVATPASGTTLNGGPYGSNNGQGLGGGARIDGSAFKPKSGGSIIPPGNELKGGGRVDGGAFNPRSGGSIVPAPAPAPEKWRGNVN